MAIAFVRKTEGNSTTTTLTLNIEVSAGSDRVLVVGLAYKSNSVLTPTSIIFNGTENFSVERAAADGGDAQCLLWKLVNPTVTTANVVITMPSSVRMVGYVAYFTGVHQTTPFTDKTDEAQGTNNTPTVDIASTADEMCIDILVQVSAGPDTATPTHTVICNGAATGDGTDTRGAGQYVIGQAMRTMNYSMSDADNWNIIAGALQEAVSVTQKSVSDTGSGSDSISIKRISTISDNGSGNDLISLINKFTISDSGSGVDLVLVKLFKLISDLGSGIDSLSIKSSILIEDSGSGIDSIALNIKLSITDTGSGSDNLIIAVKFTISDPGVGVDNININTGVTQKLVSDSGVGSDIITLNIKFTISDIGSGSDLISIINSFLVSDLGIGSDIISLLNKFTIIDTGSGNDTLNIIAKIPISDFGIGTDLISNITNRFSILDSVTGTDIINVDKGMIQKLVTDSGIGIDEIFLEICSLYQGINSVMIDKEINSVMIDTGISSIIEDKEISSVMTELPIEGEG